MDDKKKEDTGSCDKKEGCPNKGGQKCKCEEEEKKYLIEGENLFDIRNYKK